MTKLIATLTAFAALVCSANACTSIGVGKRATADGSTFATHTADSKTGDFRAVRVPRSYDLKKERPIFPASLGFPRYVGTARGKDNFKSENGATATEPIGFIPETTLNYTLAYYDAIYGVMNEAGVGIGESTCGGRIYAAARPKGKALMSIDELTRTALERCESAKCAILLMGDLAYKYGFAAAEPVAAEAGEALVVNDANEVWVFHVMAADFQGNSAVWVAQRVPDDHIAVVPNAFTIGAIDLDDKENFLASPNIFSVAQEFGYWKPGDGEFYFNKVYGSNPIIYSTRRQWRIFQLAAPSLALDPHALYLPFSVKVGALLTLEDIMWYNRDHYEGTAFDLTHSFAGGPFGAPDRYENEPRLSWERAISIHRTLYSTVLQARPNLPGWLGSILWFGFDSPHASAYTPFFAGAQKVAAPYSTGSQLRYDPSSMWWVNNLLSNYLNLRYTCMIGDVHEKIKFVERRASKEITSIDVEAKKLIKSGREDDAKKLLTKYSVQAADRLWKEWQELSAFVFTKYNDGYQNIPVVGADTCTYSLEWYESVKSLDFEDRQMASVSMYMQEGISSQLSAVNGIVLCVGMAIVAIVLIVGFFATKKEAHRRQYTLVD